MRSLECQSHKLLRGDGSRQGLHANCHLKYLTRDGGRDALCLYSIHFSGKVISHCL